MVVVGKQSFIEVIDLATEKTVTESIGVETSSILVIHRAITSIRIVAFAS